MILVFIRAVNELYLGLLVSEELAAVLPYSDYFFQVLNALANII